MIRPYLRDLINNHKPLMELNDEANDDDDTERGEWKIQLVMQNNCISTKNVEDTRTIYSASKPVDQAIEKSNERGSEFTKKVLLYCIIVFRK